MDGCDVFRKKEGLRFNLKNGKTKGLVIIIIIIIKINSRQIFGVYIYAHLR